MAKVRRLAQSEWTVMRVFWSHPAPMPASEVIEILSGKKAWHPRTIKTFLGRLVRKGALGFRARGKAYFYFARVSEAACVMAEGDSFLRKCFDGALQPMLVHFMQYYKLSPADVEELERLIEQERIQERR